MSKRYRIGLKYCGGCTPRYDRLKTVRDLRARLRDRVEFVSCEDLDVEGILVVTGCPTACVDLSPFEGLPVWVVTGEEVNGLIEKVIGMEGIHGLAGNIQK